VETNHSGELTNPSADLEQAQAEGVELQSGSSGLEEPAAQGVQQPVSRRVEQKAELVGEKPVAA
jgi:hypothetical protein